MRDRGEDVVIYGDSDPIVLTSQPRMFSIGLVLYRMRVTGSRGADLGAANHKTEITKLNAKKNLRVLQKGSERPGLTLMLSRSLDATNGLTFSEFKWTQLRSRSSRIPPLILTSKVYIHLFALHECLALYPLPPTRATDLTPPGRQQADS